MRIQVVSDLHLEFNPAMVIPNAGADILLLAGDIVVAQHLYRHPLGRDLPNGAENADKAARYRQFFDQVSRDFPRVLMVIGNHEHYSGRWNDTAAHLREALEPWANIALMDDAWLDFGGVRIVGTSLWTDLNDGDPLTMLAVKDMMNDYRAITIERDGVYHKLRPIDTLEAHRNAIATIKLATETWDGDVVVLGHHAPSRQSIHERYRGQDLMNGAFVNNLDNFILSQPKIKLWIHGHVHDPHDYHIGDCRVVCNPHGYPRERSSFEPGFIVEV